MSLALPSNPLAVPGDVGQSDTGVAALQPGRALAFCRVALGLTSSLRNLRRPEHSRQADCLRSLLPRQPRGILRRELRQRRRVFAKTRQAPRRPPRLRTPAGLQVPSSRGRGNRHCLHLQRTPRFYAYGRFHIRRRSISGMLGNRPTRCASSSMSIRGSEGAILLKASLDGMRRTPMRQKTRLFLIGLGMSQLLLPQRILHFVNSLRFSYDWARQPSEGLQRTLPSWKTNLSGGANGSRVN
jgi:hypothetical protein